MGLLDDSASIPTAPEAPEILDAEKSFSPSQLIGGRYDVRARLGAGRTGTVYRVHDCVLAEDVALKLLRPELVENSRALEGFRREVKLARKIAHPNVRRVFDIGEQDGLAFITMELVVGETLRAFIARGAGSVSARVHLFEQVARGLAAMHAEGILHRDVRVENILVREDGTAVMSDFGFAIESADESQRGNTFVYAPLHGAPEQLRGEPLDARSDVFALGLVGYEIITGSRPFGEEATTIATSAILRDASAYLTMEEVSKQVAIGLENLLLHTLAKDPNDRSSSASVADALATLREAILLTHSSAGATKPSASTAALPRRQAAARRDRLWRIALILSMIAAGALVALLISSIFKIVPTDTSNIGPPSAHAGAPASLADQQLLDRYIPIWKRMFLDKNAMSATEFTRRITSIRPAIENRDWGISMYVRYDIHTDWAQVAGGDYVLIDLYATEDKWRHLPIPRDVFLDEADTVLAAQEGVSSGVHQVQSGAHLKYPRREDAEASLRALTNECRLERTEIIDFGQPPPENLKMRGTCEIDDHQNECGIGEINLVTGDGKFNHMPCRVY